MTAIINSTMKKFFSIVFGLIIGVFIGLFLTNTKINLPFDKTIEFHSPLPLGKTQRKQIIGFLPYWLVNKADKDYTQNITTLAYFGLTVDDNGQIKKLASETEEEPGWTWLRGEELGAYLKNIKKEKVDLSLVVFNGNEDSIGKLISDPEVHAKNLVTEVGPIMKKYGFTDLNLDIESIQMASDEARQNFTKFIAEVKKNLDKEKLGTLTIDVSPIVLFKKYLINLSTVEEYVDYIVFMTYDYHYAGSYVTGPVAPVAGAGKEAEFDVEVAIKKAVKTLPKDKIILGAPLYGYSWETIGDTPRSPVLSSSGFSVSNRYVEDFLSTCATCEAKLDKNADENFIIYKDQDYGTYHQIFYPDKNSMTKKINLAKKYNLGGLGLWALGYEGEIILNPLIDYKESF